MVWSNQETDRLRIPVNPQPGQDYVELSGADIPAELQTLLITAVIIFWRGSYPSEGANPETKYYYFGITNTSALAMGSVLDKKPGLVPINTMTLPFTWFPDSNLTKYPDGYRGETTQVYESDFTMRGVPFFAEFWQAESYGVSADANGWVPVTLLNGWQTGTLGGFYQGLRFTVDAAGNAWLNGNIRVPAVGTVSQQVICDITTVSNLPFRTEPDKHFAFTSLVAAGPSLICSYDMRSDGELRQSNALALPPANGNLIINLSYPIRPFR